MKIVLLTTLTARPFLSQVQQATPFAPFPDNGVYLSVTDVMYRTVADGFDAGQSGYRLHDELAKHAVKITQPTDKAVDIPTANVWGARIRDIDYRLVDGDLSRVEHADRIFLFSNPPAVSQPARPAFISAGRPTPRFTRLRRRIWSQFTTVSPLKKVFPTISTP